MFLCCCHSIFLSLVQFHQRKEVLIAKGKKSKRSDFSMEYGLNSN
jgi:hypothetical protein